ncbi:MAG: hypothetical protein CMQ54_01960 [Gammaproteobacteria bacterium]|nr:hypothetical protein [Gammaproteobacteria bacterium]
MDKIRYYSPLRFVYGLLIFGSALLKTGLAKLLYSKERRVFGSIDEDCFVLEEAENHPENIRDIAIINEACNDTSKLKSVVDGAFVDWTDQSNTHYLIPNKTSKNALVSILHRSNMLWRLSAHHGFEFYCKNASVFKTQESESVGTTSVNFHRDGHPPFTYKLMVYLTDVDECSGAFAIKPDSFKKMILPTFGSYNYKRNPEDSNYKKFGLLGIAGTKVLFKNNALHAGGRTKKGERVVVTFLLHPRFSSRQESSAQSIDWMIGGREYSLF